MAASAAAAGSSPGLCPNYAVICSFLERYGALLDLPELTFSQLERYLLDTSAVPKLLVDLHVKLLRKIGKSVSADRWEKYLVKVCQEFNTTWAWELEKKGYKELTVECKTGILKYLCECQFDDNVKFKTAINEEDPDKMRLQPIGRDKDGLMYWFQLDQDNNVRVYVEEQDDLDGSSWKCIVRERNDLAEILALLKTQIDPALLTKKDQEEGPSPEDGENKKKGEEGGVKKTEDTSEDEDDKPPKDTVCSVSAEMENKEKAAQKEDSKLNVLDAKSPSNGIQDNQTDSASTVQSEKPVADDKVTINNQTIKEEPMEVSESKEATATSATEPPTEKQCGALQTEQAEEVRRKTAEELQRAMKNDQQAKIPLKKREMKLSEDFDNTSGSSSSIIVRNPSVLPVKEAPKVEEINKEVSVASVGMVKELKSDHVNGDTQPATETTFNNGLRESPKEMGAQEDSADRKEQQTKAIAGEGSIAVESVAKETTNLPLDKKVIKDIDEEKNVASNSEETKEVTMSDEISPQKNIPAMKAEKESTDIPEEVKTAALKVAKAPSTLTAEPLPLCKDAASPSEKSTDCKEEDKLNVSKEINVMVAPIDDNTSTSKETHKIPSPDNSQKLDGVQGTDSLVASKEVKLDAPKETDKIVVPKDTDTSVVKEMEKPAVTEKQSDSKNTEITVITKETGRLDPITEKPDDKLTESPAVVKKTEKPSSNKAGTENVDGPQKTETSLVIKKTEIPEQMKDSENLGSLKETKTSSVIKKADKPSFNKDTEKLDSTKETDKSSVIKKMEQKGPSKRIEKCGDPEDTVVSSIIKEKPAVTAADTKVIAEEKEKPVLEKDSEKSVTCKDTEKTGVAEVNEKSVPKDVEMVAVTEKLTHPQLDESKKVKKLATAKDTETVSKEMEKSSCPKGEKSDTTKETKKQADTKSGDAKEVVKLATNEDAKQLPSPKNAASGKGDQEEPMEVSLEKCTDESIKTQADVDQESKKVVKSGEKCEPNKQEQDTNKEKLEHTNHLPTETDGDKEIKSDSTVEKMEDGKEDKQEKDDKNRTTAEECDDAKVSEGSAEDKPNDEGEKRDAETTGKGAAGGGEVSSEIQEEGIRLKIRIPTHRRKSDLQREERRGDSESDTGEGRSLRRSPRICRPTAKGVEFQDRRIEKKQATPPVEKGEEEEEEEEEEKAVQKKPREKKVDQEGQPKAKGKRRRRTRWSNTRTRSRKKKGSGEDDDDDDDESSQEESEEDDSDEDFKVERGKNRRRNRNRERRSSDSSTSSDDLPPNDDPCKHCGLPNHPELILLCDSCDNGYHTACLRPPLMIIPDGEWFCPPCQHKLLCDKLEEQLLNLDAALKKKERAERRKERLVYVGISLENIIDPSVELDEEKQEEEVVVKKEKKEVKKGKSWGRRSTRTKKCISYRFDEFDEAIEEAIEEDIKEAEGGGAGRGKDMANITGHRGKDMSVIMQAEEGKENGGPPRPSAGQRRKKRRRLNDLDSDSTMEEEESEDEFRISDSSEEEFVVSENDAESEVEAGSNNDSDFGSSGDGRRCRTSWSKRPSKRRRSTRQPRKRRRPRGYSDDEEEETDEEEEEEIATEGSSEYSDSDLDMSRRRSRRSQKKQVNYCETSESEGSKAGTNRDKVTARRRFASSDSEASPAKDSDDEEKERTVKRRADSSEEESKQRRRRISLKRRRASEDDDDDDSDSDESEEEERPVRKRVNRIDSDDDDDDEEKEEEKEKKVVAEKEDEEGGVLGKGTSPLDYNLVELPPTNGQNPMKGLEGLAVGAPGLMTQLGPKNVSTTPAVAVAPNGLVSQEMAPQDDDEDDLLGVTDLVDYVCNSEQL